MRVIQLSLLHDFALNAQVAIDTAKPLENSCCTLICRKRTIRLVLKTIKYVMQLTSCLDCAVSVQYARVTKSGNRIRIVHVPYTFIQDAMLVAIIN